MFGKHFQASTGVPQVGSWSPHLFNVLIDAFIDDLNISEPAIDIVAYADNVVIIGKFAINNLIKFAINNLIGSTYIAEVTLNMDNCSIFHHKLTGIKQKST